MPLGSAYPTVLMSFSSVGYWAKQPPPPPMGELRTANRRNWSSFFMFIKLKFTLLKNQLHPPISALKTVFRFSGNLFASTKKPFCSVMAFPAL